MCETFRLHNLFLGGVPHHHTCSALTLPVTSPTSRPSFPPSRAQFPTTSPERLPAHDHWRRNSTLRNTAERPDNRRSIPCLPLPISQHSSRPCFMMASAKHTLQKPRAARATRMRQLPARLLDAPQPMPLRDARSPSDSNCCSDFDVAPPTFGLSYDDASLLGRWGLFLTHKEIIHGATNVFEKVAHRVHHFLSSLLNLRWHGNPCLCTRCLRCSRRFRERFRRCCTQPGRRRG